MTKTGGITITNMSERFLRAFGHGFGAIFF